MLDGSPQTFLHDPILAYLDERGVKINLRSAVRDLVHDLDADGKPTRVTGLLVGVDPVPRKFDVVVCATDLPGAKRVLPDSFRQFPIFDKIYQLDTVPIATVQLRFDGWVTEMQDDAAMKRIDVP